jgi:hypothetical protein
MYTFLYMVVSLRRHTDTRRRRRRRRRRITAQRKNILVSAVALHHSWSVIHFREHGKLASECGVVGNTIDAL